LTSGAWHHAAALPIDPFDDFEVIMSIHGTFRSKGGFAAHRNVLSRGERIERLKIDGKWSVEKNSVFNLPKVRNIKMT